MTGNTGRRRSRVGCVFSALALVVVLGGATVIGIVYGHNQLQPVGSDKSNVAFVVNPGEGLDALTSDLDGKHLIKSTFWFGWYARFMGLTNHLHPGVFDLTQAMGASEIINILEGDTAIATHRLVVTEGMRATDIAVAVGKLGVGVTAAQYTHEVTSGQFGEAFLVGRPVGAGLEGFLFPDTYNVPDGATAHDIVEMQLRDFAAKAQPLFSGSVQSEYATLVTASIVEREAKFDVDRPLVAGVISNRLNQDVKLQVDASVIYGLGATNLILTSDQLATDTPYNTYIHPGLPPTPISNPGVASIQAALHPTATQYMYYVSDGCGHIYYSITAEQHQAQVNQYLGTSCP